LVLKLIRSAGDGFVTVTLTGRMTGEHVEELRTLIRADDMHNVVLDLRDVTLVDHRVVAFLARCQRQGVRLVNAAEYIHEWIRAATDG
jgi:anti-anti-sigma regulatory factor